MNEDITNFPLSWPFGWERTQPNRRKHSQFGSHTVAASARELESEIRLMRGRNMVISTNKQVKANGIPYANQRTPEDAGGDAVMFDKIQKAYDLATGKAK